jgi:hypothetical protein
VVALGLGVVLAAVSDKGASYTAEEVVEAFSRHGFALAEPGRVAEDDARPDHQTIRAVFAPSADTRVDIFLFPPEQDFYVFVARNDAFASEFFEPLAEHGGGPGTFDLLRGNVVVSSDASLTQAGLSRDQRRRIRAAVDSLQPTGAT